MSFYHAEKTRTRKGKGVSTYGIQRYLEVRRDGTSRILARDFVGFGSKREQDNWARLMDETRRLAGNDGSYRRNEESVLYWHFVISPDPKDAVDIDTLRSLTMDWVYEWFGSPFAPGKLGTYEVAVVYHDDNEQHIPHAHIIVNNTNMDTAKRLHINKKIFNEELFDSVQEISRAYGLHHFERGSRGLYINQDRYYTKKERQLEREGKYSWKADLCRRVDIARRSSRSTQGFFDELHKLGVSVREKENDWVFSINTNPDRWHARGYRLGKDYTKEHIENYLHKKANGTSALTLEKVQENVNRAIVAELIATAEVAAVIDASVTLKEASDTLRVNDEFNICCFEDYDLAMLRQVNLFKRLKEISPEDAEEAKQNYMRIEAAKKVAERGDFFLGVADQRQQAKSSTQKQQGFDDEQEQRMSQASVSQTRRRTEERSRQNQSRSR